MRKQWQRAAGTIAWLAWTVGLAAYVSAFQPAQAETNEPSLLFCLGTPDQRAAEFGLTAPGEDYTAYLQKFSQPVVYTVGQSSPRDWPYIHPAPKDKWAGGRAHTFTIRFASGQDQRRVAVYFSVLVNGGDTGKHQMRRAWRRTTATEFYQRVPAGRLAHGP